MSKLDSMTDDELLNEFCATTSYNNTGDWRNTPATAVDPIDDQSVDPMAPALAKKPVPASSHKPRFLR